MTETITRRATLFGLAATPVLAGAGPASAQAPILAPQAGSGAAAGLRFRSVVVDTTRVAALGNSAGAERLAIVLGRWMREVFADLMAPSAPAGATLVARIASLYLTSYAGSRDSGMHGSGSGNDSLDGAGIVTSGGRTLSETPILAVLDPAYSGPWYLPDIDERRVDSISHQFAWWLRREMGV